MKETNEFSQWAGGAVDAVNRSLPDITFADLGNLIPTVAGATQAVGGFSKIGGEYAAASPGERDDDAAVFESALSSLEDDTADLIARSQDGFKAIWALAVKATRKEDAEKLAAFHSGPSALSDATDAGQWLDILNG